MARWSSKLNLLLTAQDALSRPVRVATGSINAFSGAANRATGSLRGFGLQAARTMSDMRGFSRVLDITTAGAVFAATRLDRMTTMMRAQTGGTRREIDALQDTMLGLAVSSHASIETVTELTTALGNVGETVTQNDTSLIRMIDTWGISAQSAVEFRKSAEHLGTELETLLDTAVGYQNRFKLPGIVAQMPGLMDRAIKATTQFSRSVVRDERDVINSTIKTGAVISRAFGKPFAEGLRMAESHFTHFSEALENTRNVFLGIEDDFSPMHHALFEVGFDIQHVQQILANGRDDPIAFAENISKIYERLRATGRSVFAERFLVNVKRASDETTRILLDPKRREAAKKERDLAIQIGGANWAETTEKMRKNAETAISAFHDLLGLGKLIIGSGFNEIIREVFGKDGVGGTMEDFSRWMLEAKKSLLDGKLYNEGIKPLAVAVGKLFVHFQTFGGVLGIVSFGLGALTSAIKFILSPIDVLTGLADKGLGVIGFLADMLGNAALATAGFTALIPGLDLVLTPLFGGIGIGLKAIGLGFNGLGAVGTKNLGIITLSLERIGALINSKAGWKGALKGASEQVVDFSTSIGGIIDSSLGGLPSKIANYFNPPTEADIRKKYKGLGLRFNKAIGDWQVWDRDEKIWRQVEYNLSDRFKNLGEKVKGYLAEWNDAGFVPATENLFKSIGASVDKALSGAPTQIMNALFPDDRKAFEERTAAFGKWIGEKLAFWTDAEAVGNWWQEQLNSFDAWLNAPKTIEMFKGWGNNIGTAIGKGVSLVKKILGLGEDDSLKDEARKTFIGVGRSLGNAIMEGIGSAFTAEALAKAAPTFVKYFVLPYYGVKALGGNKEAEDVVSKLGFQIAFQEAQEEVDKKQAAANKRTAAANKIAAVSPLAATRGPTAKAGASDLTSMLATTKAMQKEKDWFLWPREAAMAKLGTDISDIYKSAAGPDALGAMAGTKGNEALLRMNALQNEINESPINSILQNPSKYNLEDYPVVLRLNAEYEAIKTRLTAERNSLFAIVSSMDSATADSMLPHAMPYIGRLDTALSALKKYTGAGNYSFLRASAAREIETSIAEVMTWSHLDKLKEEIAGVSQNSGLILLRSSMLKTMPGISNDVRKMAATEDRIPLEKTGLLSPFQGTKPVPPPLKPANQMPSEPADDASPRPRKVGMGPMRKDDNTEVVIRLGINDNILKDALTASIVSDGRDLRIESGMA